MLNLKHFHTLVTGSSSIGLKNRKIEKKYRNKTKKEKRFFLGWTSNIPSYPALFRLVSSRLNDYSLLVAGCSVCCCRAA